MASTDGRPVPIKNTAYRATFPILDADGDLVTGATGLDSEVSKDAGAFTDCTNEATEIATASGMYYVDLTSTEMNADTVAVIVKTSTVGAKTTVLVFYPQEAGDIKVDVESISGDSTAADNCESFFDGTGYVGGTAKLTVDLTKWNGTTVASPDTAGYPKVTVKSGTGTGELSLTSGQPTGSAGKIVTSPGYLGIFKTTNSATFFCNTFSPTTSAAKDADSPPTARVYNQNGTLIDGAFSMSKVDDSNTTGFYSDNIDLVDEGMNIAGGRYFIYIEAVVDGITGTTCCTFDVEPTVTTTIAGTVNVNVTEISGDSTAADNLEAAFDGTGYAGGTIKPTVDVTKWNGTAVSSPATAGIPDVNVKNAGNTAWASGAITASVIATDAITAGKIAADAIGASELAADAVTEIVTAVWAKVCETQGSYTAQQIMSIILSALAGVTDDGGATFKTPNGVSVRISATVVSGDDERTAITLTPSS